MTKAEMEAIENAAQQAAQQAWEATLEADCQDVAAFQSLQVMDLVEELTPSVQYVRQVAIKALYELQDKLSAGAAADVKRYFNLPY